MNFLLWLLQIPPLSFKHTRGRRTAGAMRNASFYVEVNLVSVHAGMTRAVNYIYSIPFAEILRNSNCCSIRSKCAYTSVPEVCSSVYIRVT